MAYFLTALAGPQSCTQSTKIPRVDPLLRFALSNPSYLLMLVYLIDLLIYLGYVTHITRLDRPDSCVAF